jgi:hypothetical protein
MERLRILCFYHDDILETNSIASHNSLLLRSRSQRSNGKIQDRLIESGANYTAVMTIEECHESAGCFFRFIDSHEMTAIVEYHLLSMWHQLAKIVSTFASKELERDLSMNNDGHDPLNNVPDLDDPKESELGVVDPSIAHNDAPD